MKIIHFADLHLGVENYGRLDPATGLSTRLMDFLRSFDEMVDYAVESKADLVLFCGDAYKTREPTQTQQREFARRINRLATSGIPVFILTGNHDMPNAVGRATATEIFDTLAVKNVTVANKPGTCRITTKSGDIQIVALPWLRRSTLLSRNDARNLPLEEVNRKLQDVLTSIIDDQVKKLDPALPAILAGHVSISTAKTGSETMMSIGQEHVLLLSSVKNPAFDYVALGHIHKQQVLNEDPPVVYSGSLERVDFGEEDDDKGFYDVDITTDEAGKRHTDYRFHTVRARRFRTLHVELTGEELDPTTTILNSISAQQEQARDAVVRLNIKLPASQEKQLRDTDIREALKDADYLSITLDRQRTVRTRTLNGVETAGELPPLASLKAWLETQEMSPERREEILSYGQRLIEE